MTQPATLRARHVPSVGFNLGLIGLGVVLLMIVFAYGIEGWLGRLAPKTPPDAPPVVRTLVGRTFSIPARWLHEPAGSPDRFVTRIALRIPLPLGHDGAMTPIDVTLLPASQARPSALLVDGVYLHQFLPNELEGPPGLIGKPLYGSDGYENETVWYDPISADPFVAKCMAPIALTTGARCLRTVYLTTGIAAVYAFDSSVLWSWRKFDRTMGGALARLGI